MKLIKDLDWTYVVAVHAADVRSQTGAQRLKELARNESICVDVLGYLPVAFDKNESTKIAKMVDKVWEARSAAGTSTLGVIFYGNGYEGTLFSKAFSDKVQLPGESNPIQLILSEESSEWAPDQITNSAIPDNTMMLQPKTEYIREFEEHLNTIYSLQSNFSSAATPIEEAIREFYNETGRMPSTITNNTKNPLVTEAIDSVFSLAVAYRKAQKQKCGDLNRESNCDELKTMSRSELTGYVKGLHESYDKLPGQVSPVEFAAARRPIGQTLGFDVVLFNKSGNSLHIQKVGS